MSKKQKIYCQPLTLGRLNLWLWVTSMLLLGIILQLEKTGAVNWLSIVLGVSFILIASYLVLSSYLTAEKGQIALYFPFSRQPLLLDDAQVLDLVATKHTVNIELTHRKFSYRFLMSAKQQAALLKLWKG